jgi:hypothetical protein
LSNPTDEFFAGLSRRGYEPLLQRMDRVLRFDLSEDGQTVHWLLTVRRGELVVSQGEGGADCVITTSRKTFDRIARGETKALAAWLRNLIAVEGQLYPLIMLERLLPGPPGAHDPRAIATSLLAGQRSEPAGEPDHTPAAAPPGQSR